MIPNCIPPKLKDWPIHLIVDDTLVEKVGDPIFIKNEPQYIKVHLEYRLWIPKKQRIVEQDEQNNLEMADVMIADAINLLGMDRHFVIDCDAWYSKAPLTN